MVVRTEFNGIRRFGDPRDIEVSSFEIEKEDVMKFKPLYEALYLFLQEEKYKHPVFGEPEELYWERWTPTGAKEQHFWWRLSKDSAKPYIRYLLVLNMQTLNVTKEEVAYKNKKVKGEKTDLIIRGTVFVQWDIKDEFRNSWAWRFRQMFFNNLYKDEIEFHKNEARAFSLKLQRLFKQYLEMTADSEIPQLFQPPLGYKE